MLDRFAARSQSRFSCTAVPRWRGDAAKPYGSTDSGQILKLPITHPLVEAPNRILMEVRRVAVMIERSLVHVLLVDQHCAGVPFDKVRDVAHTSRLLSRSRRQEPQPFGDLLAILLLKPHPYDKTQHSLPFSLLNGCRKVIVLKQAGLQSRREA
jgi:hypothetical protein